MTAAELERGFYDFFYNLKYNPIATGANTLVEYEDLKNVVVGSIYAPNTWRQLASALDGLYRGNTTDFAILAAAFAGATSTSATPDAEAAIKCSDKTVRTPTKEAMLPHVHDKYNISKILGDVYVSIDFECAQWKFCAQEIYRGDFHTKTANPILLVSNTYDPLTPLVSAQNMSSGLEGSVVLEQVAYGVRANDSLSCPHEQGMLLTFRSTQAFRNPLSVP